METEFKSKAQILDNYRVEVQAPDGELFTIYSQIGTYLNKDTQAYYLHLCEWVFDKNFSEDKETMIDRIWNDMLFNGIEHMGMDEGNRSSERKRIGARIRELREKKRMEARDLALLAGIDAANLSRIEQGKYSTGLDILSRIACVLGARIDLVTTEE